MVATKPKDFSISIGRVRGYPVTKIEKQDRPVNRRKCRPSVKRTHDLIRELVGFAPYERRILELLKVGKDKRALKFAKRRIGGHLRAKRKREDMNRVNQQQRRKRAD